LVMLFETVVLVLTCIRAIRHFRKGSSGLITVIYRDGLLFYLCLFAFSAGNVIVLILVPPQYANVITTPQRAMHSIVSARLLLNLREAGARSHVEVLGTYGDTTSTGDEVFSLRSMQFGPRHVRINRESMRAVRIRERNGEGMAERDEIETWFGKEDLS